MNAGGLPGGRPPASVVVRSTLPVGGRVRQSGLARSVLQLLMFWLL